MSAIIEKEGDFKFARIDITNKETKEVKTIVRGYSTCNWHHDIVNKFKDKELANISEEVKSKWEINSPGGGKLKFIKE